MIIEVKNKEKQQINIIFKDEWERSDYSNTLACLFRFYELEIEKVDYDIQNNTIIIELNESQTKLLKEDLVSISFFEFNEINHNTINSIKIKETILILSIL